MLWGAIPCIDGSPWQHINVLRGAGEKVREHQEKAMQLWRLFMKGAHIVKARGGTIAFEWPYSCQYWGWHSVRKFISAMKMVEHRIDGCACGLTSIVDGRPILKPWRIATDSSHMVWSLLPLRCPGKPKHTSHALCQGRDTERSGHYPPKLARPIHDAFYEH